MWTNDVLPIEKHAAIQEARQQEMLREAESRRMLREIEGNAHDAHGDRSASRFSISQLVVRLKQNFHSHAVNQRERLAED
jgi:hypothetical protein